MPKRDRTRERLRIATLQVLNQRGYEDMRTLTITEQARLSEGVFYQYFKSKVDITIDLLQEFYNGFALVEISQQRSEGPFEAIKAANRIWLELAVSNPGLMRCIFQAGNEVPEIATLVSQVNKNWYARAQHAVERHRPSLQKSSMILPLYMLGGMMDELARRLVVYPDPELLAVMAEIGADHDAVADAASVIWFRILYLDDEVPLVISDQAQKLIGQM